MQRNSPSEIIPAIINSLRKGAQTINQLSKSSDINRVTLSQYLQAFEKAGIIITKKSGREKFIQLRSNPDSYFDLPIKEEDNKYLSTIYAIIKEACQKTYKKEPTKTQVYKILYELDKNLPIGWYQHGPCAVRIYRGNEEKLMPISKEDEVLIKNKVKEYCKLNNFELQKIVYSKENNRLYLLKEKLITLEKASKDELNLLLTEFIHNVPKETFDVAVDFLRSALLVGWEKSRLLFQDHVWKYISLVVFKESLKEYYGESIEDYLSDRIEDVKEETRKIIYYLVEDYMDTKYSQDERYQSWKKKRQNA